MVLSILLASGCAPGIRSGPTQFLTPPGELPQAVDILYTIALETSPFPLARITLVTAGTPDGKTRFMLPDRWDGIEQCENEVHGLVVNDRSGRSLPFEKPKGNHWHVTHVPGEVLTVSYFLVPTIHTLTSKGHAYYRPIVREDLFHLIGQVGLIYPEHLATGEKKRIAVRWKGFREAGLKVISSFSADQVGFEVDTPLDDFRHGLFYGGKLRIHERKVKGKSVYVALTGDDWAFSDDAFVDVTARIIEAERTFFDDFDYPYYLVTLLPIGKRAPKSFWTGGTGLTNSFALFMPEGLGLDADSDEGKRIRHLLAHELFHNWNGLKISLDEPEELGYWFSEGLTNHYTRSLLLRAGLFSLDAYLEDLNEAVTNYMLSPVRNVPNERIREDFWASSDVHDLPYRRGDMAAFLLDHGIREASKGKRGLDDFMKEILTGATAQGEGGGTVNTEKLLAKIEAFASVEVAERIRKIIVEGETVDFPSDILEPCLSMETRQIGAFTLGFDFEGSRKAKVVMGVEEGSNAYEAGLCNGQRLAGWSVFRNQPEKQVELTIREGEAERTISYLPQGDPMSVPQFSRGEGYGEACEEKL